MVLVFVLPVGDEVRLRPIGIGNEMRAHLIQRRPQIGVDRQRVRLAVVAGRANALALRLNRVEDTNGIDEPDQGWLPIYLFSNPLQRLIGRHGKRRLFAAHAQRRVRKERVSAGYLILDGVSDFGFQIDHLLLCRN